MGNSSIQQNREARRLKEEVQDDRFGGKIILEYQKPQIYATKTLKLISKQQLNATIELITKRSKLVHKNFSTVKNYTVYDKKDLCSQIICLNIVFEFYQNDLEKQIKRRQSKQLYFTEDQIYKKIYQICDCLNFLEQRKCYHGDIKSSTVFLDRKGNVKLQDSFFTHHGKTNLQFVISKSNTKTYLSPSQLNLLRNGGYSEKKDQTYKNEIFSMGMTILQAMLLQSSHDCYDMLGKCIIDKKLKAKLFKARQIYSPQLVSIITSILSMQSQKRPSYLQLLNNEFIKRNGNDKKSLSFDKEYKSQIQIPHQNDVQKLNLKKKNSNTTIDSKVLKFSS